MDLNDPLDVMARTLWGEARSGGAAGMRHVASVILNRANHPRWWGSDIRGVCLAPMQFSCWNSDDINRPKLEAVGPDDPWFLIAKVVSAAAIAGNLVDATLGADSYFAHSMSTKPSWAAHAVHTYSDGWHDFYRVELDPPGQSVAVTTDG